MANLADFIFTNGSDLAIDSNDGIFNEDTQVDTLNGNDIIRGIGGYTGVQNNGEINTGDGRDLVFGQGDGNGIYLDNDSILNTGNDSDLIKGVAGDIGYGIFNQSIIDTGSGNDRIVGEAGRVGIINYHTIDTGEGDDLIKGSGIFGINHTGTINTGKGNDIVIGEGGNDGFGIGIYDGGMLNTGSGNDLVIGEAGNNDFGIQIAENSTLDTGDGNDRLIGKGVDPFTGFNGGGIINLGQGDDLIRGFGAVNVNGGEGFEQAKFDFNYHELNDVVELGSSDNALELIFNDSTMTLSNIESFVFANGSFSFDELVTEFSDFV